MIPQYLDLNKKGGAPARLAILRNMAAHTNAPDVNMPPSRRLADWRAARENTLLTDMRELSQGFNTKYHGSQYEKRMPVWTTFSAVSPFRYEEFVDELDSVNIDHRGWFTDADCSTVLRGVVVDIGRGRFLAGYVSSDTGERVYFCKLFDCEKEAAWFADAEAKELAEEEQAYSERWQAAQSLHGDIEAMENDVAELFPMRHHARARRELSAIIIVLRAKRATLANDYADIEF